LNNSRCDYFYDPSFYRPVYVRYDRSRQGCLSAGDAFCDSPLVTMDGEDTTLDAHVKAAEAEGRALVMICGSYS